MNRREAIERTALVLGYAVSAPAIMGILKGCKAEPELNFVPVFFTPEQAALVAEISGIIIPKTDTPGAKEVGVPGFIDKLIHEVYTKEDQDRFIQNLDEFAQEARKQMGNDFLEGRPEQQLEFIDKKNREALEGYGQADSTGWWAAGSTKQKPFILKMKELTLLGFFTSEAGATQVLQYNQTPGPFQGCVPLAQVGKTWAT